MYVYIPEYIELLAIWFVSKYLAYMYVTDIIPDVYHYL